MPILGNSTQQVILTTPPGESLANAFTKVNDNFTAVWAAGPVGSNIFIANSSIYTRPTNESLVLNPNGIGAVTANAHVIPDTANIRDLGSSVKSWRNLYVQYATVSGNLTVAGSFNIPGDLDIGGNLTVNGNVVYVGNISTETKTINLANSAVSAANANGSGITVGSNANIATFLYDSNNNFWTTNIGFSPSALYIGNTLFTRTLTVGRATTPVTIPLATNNSFNVLTQSGNVTVLTT